MKTRRHYTRPIERPLKADEIDRVIVLLGGGTAAHDRLVAAGMRGQGYRVETITNPGKQDFEIGREYCDHGLCSPAYFTIGGLIRTLHALRCDRGLSVQQIIDQYAYLIAGSCGPCRFGMYEAQFRMALKNSGFDGFRVLVYQYQRPVNVSGADQPEGAFLYSARFFCALYNAMMAADVVNSMIYQIRPYEKKAGMTDRAAALCLAELEQGITALAQDLMAPSRVERWLSTIISRAGAEWLVCVSRQLVTTRIRRAFARCVEIFENHVQVDYLRPRAVVKVTGEFWAQMTEGDGNYRMFQFLESRGAECILEPVITWLDYILQITHREISACTQSVGIARGSVLARWARRARARTGAALKVGVLRFAQVLLHRQYKRLRRACRYFVPPLADLYKLERFAEGYYNPKTTGGEGYLEVAKNIYYTGQQMAHMVLSLKPFGCLPSTQSDGVQVALPRRFPDMIFLPVETSGEGEVSALSRVDMVLTEAKMKVQREFLAAQKACPYSLDEVYAYIERHPALRRPIQPMPRSAHTARASRFLHLVAAQMARAGLRPRNVAVSADAVLPPHGTDSTRAADACAPRPQSKEAPRASL